MAITLVLWLALFAGGSLSWGANVLQTYYVPLPEDQMQISLNTIDAFRGLIGDVMVSAISILVGTDGTIIYYDHWEDGYEEEITDPQQPTSQIWGDGDPSNGFPPGYPNDILNAGDVILLESEIDVTRNHLTLEYDARDKVATTLPVVMTRGLYAKDPGEVLAEATGVYDISTHGTLYRTPVGVGTGTGNGTNMMFSYSGLYIMADHDFTRIDLDLDNDGVFEETVYLNAGEPYFVNGGVVAGATAKGSQPFQCILVTGDIGSSYEMRWIELWPENQWGTDYVTPMCSRTVMGGNATVPAVAYLFNPNEERIRVYYETKTSSGSFWVEPNSVYDTFMLPANSATRFYTMDGSKFIGASIFDTTWGGANYEGYLQHCQTYDWGLGLTPVNMMSTAGLVGWGPGVGTTVALNANGNPIWVTALTNTTIYVDLDGDPNTGPLVDPLGNRYDFTTNIAPLDVAFLVDTNDNDQTGMRFYTLDGTPLMAAWGQDSARSETGNPFLDMGYPIQPFPAVLSTKAAALLHDLNGNGYADEGDTIEYFIDVVNVGFATAHNVMLVDDLPTDVTAYVSNSSMVAKGGVTNAIDDNLPPMLTRFPFDEGGYDLGTVMVGETTTVRYVTQVLDDLPPDFDGYIHNNATVGSSNETWSGGVTIPARARGLTIAKETSTTELLEPGDTYWYTVTLANTGTVTYTGVTLDDVLPVGVSYVPNTAQIQVSGAMTNTVSDRFNSRSFTNSNGTIPWITAWEELGEADGPNAGGVQVRADGATNVPMEAFTLLVGGSGRGASRTADLSGHTSATLSFVYRRQTVPSSTGVDLWISTNGWASSNRLFQSGTGHMLTRTTASYNVSAYISTNTSIRFLTRGNLDTNLVAFDNVTFTLVGNDATFAGMPPPMPAQNLTLPPGGGATVTFQVQVDNPPLATQVVNQARVRADQDQSWTGSNAVTNDIHATEHVALVKTSSPNGMLGAGSNVAYNIEIINTGTIWQTNIRLEDLVPWGMSYVDGSAELIRRFTHTHTYLDAFHFRTYENDDGNMAWAGPWTETGDDGSPLSGNVSIQVDSGSVPGQTYALRMTGNHTIQRPVNLAGASAATLSLDYRRWGLISTSRIIVYASRNGTSFTELGRIEGATNDGSYFPRTFNLSSYIGENTIIRFTGQNLTSARTIWLDNIRIDATMPASTNALPNPPTLLEGMSLPPGTSMTVRLTAKIDDPLVCTQFVNVARLQSDQQPDWLESQATNYAAGTVGVTLDKSSLLEGNWDLGATNVYEIVIENTGTVTLVGVDLADVLPPGTEYVPGSATVAQVPPPSVQTQLYTTAGTRTFVVPDGVYSLEVFAIGGGGGGATQAGNQGGGGGGGGGGASSWAEFPVTPGEVLTVTVGAGGAANSAGSDSWVRNEWMTNVLARGGSGAAQNARNGAAGGRASGGIGDVGYDGGNGANGVDRSYGGGGGSSAGTQVAGNNASGSAGAIAPAGGGNGGDGRSGSQGNGTAGSTPGGGGGGAYRTSGTRTGGAGAAGMVMIRYTDKELLTVEDPPNLLTDITIHPGETITVGLAATLGYPLVSTQFVNTATLTMDQRPPLEATATNYSVANSVGDRVWFDLNGDGIQEEGEPGLGGVEVLLYAASGVLLDTTTSDAQGAYAFTNLPSGSYFLEFEVPSAYAVSPQGQGGDSALDSDISPATGRTAVFTLSGGTNDTTRDAGLYQPPASLGNYIWHDVNGNGIQDDLFQSRLPPVVVTLYDADDNEVATTVTDNGYYSFTNLAAGYYYLQFEAPEGYAHTLQNQGADSELDSDASPLTGRTEVFYLPVGVNDLSWDAGFVPEVRGLTITKNSSQTGACLSPGDTISYTVVVANTGNVEQAGIMVEDMLPAGVTYVPGSVAVQFYSPEFTTSVTFNANGTFTVPAGVGQVRVEAWGGGGGGASRSGIFNTGAGGGGGGGAYSRRDFSVSPGASYSVQVGGGGGANAAGGDSRFRLGTTDLVLAKGGNGTSNNSDAGASGGAANAGVGDVRYGGGSGANGSGTSYGGGGGSSAGPGAAGNNASGSAGAAAPPGGGNGGGGATSQGGGSPGSVPGGGGGGAVKTSTFSSTTYAGGAGAAGRVVVWYATAPEGTVGAPPALWSGGTLGVGETATFTFEVTADSPPVSNALTNRASVYSAMHPALSAVATNCVVSADVGVLKTVTKEDPDQAEMIEYILTATNNGPNVATGVKITDVLPSGGLQYNSHSNGNYTRATGIWDIGTLGVGASTTLYISVTAREYAGLRITNTATITSRDLFDPNPNNDTSSVVVIPKGGAVVGDLVWFDANRNGIQDPEEELRIEGLPVYLVNAKNEVVDEMLTDAGGNYLFTDVVPGVYTIHFDLTGRSTWVGVSPRYQGDDPALDSNPELQETRSTERLAVTDPFSLRAWETNLTIDLGLIPLKPTRVTLVDVWGEARGDAGVVAWQTDSEWHTAGFRIYRLAGEDDAGELVTPRLVTSVLSSAGGLYEWEDPQAEAGGTGWYRLEEVEMSGMVNDLGTYELTFGAPPPAALAARAAAADSSRKRAVLAKPAAPVGLAGPSSVLKASYPKAGLYALSLAELAEGMGQELEAVEALAHAQRLALSVEGDVVPSIHDAVNGRLIFHGRATDNWYARGNVVMISVGDGQSMTRREPGATHGDDVLPARVRFEEDNYYLNTVNNLPDDFYYWDYVISAPTENAASVKSFPLDLRGFAGSDVAIKVSLQGWSSTPGGPDHLAEFRFNGEWIGSATFDDQEVCTVELLAPITLASNGLNTFEVKGVLQEGHSYSFFVVNWIEATFARELTPEGNPVFHEPGKMSAYAAPAFTQPLVVALDRYDRPVWIADEDGGLPNKAWASSSSDRRYALEEWAELPQLPLEVVAEDPWFMTPDNRVDYLIVVSRALEAAVQELADYRASQGLRVGVATFEDLCDWMAGGLRTPEAISELLAYANATWAQAPWMVLLAGSGHYDFLDTQNFGGNHIPPLLVQTDNGFFSSDNLLTDYHGDGLPNASVGRLPARDAGDLAAMIAKIKVYEQSFGSDWLGRWVLVSDKADALAGDFGDVNDALEGLAGPEREVIRIDRRAMNAKTAKTTLTSAIRTGAGMVHYTGHGSAQAWNEHVLASSDAPGLQNAEYPMLVVALSCLVGHHEDPLPNIESLGEALLRAPGSGAVAAWGPSGLSDNQLAQELGLAFYDVVLQKKVGTLGPAVLEALRSVEHNQFSFTTYAMYNLLGDPALRIANNRGDGGIAENFAEWRWERFSPDELADPEVSAATPERFYVYAFDNDGMVEPVEGGVDVKPQGGSTCPTCDDEELVVQWRQRARSLDVDYRLLISDDLVTWRPADEEIVILDVEVDPDEVMETIRARVPCSANGRVFVGLEAIQH